MRRTLGVLLLAVLAGGLIGCIFSGNLQPEAADVGPPAGDKARTLEYWGKVRDAMREKSSASELRQLATAVRRQAETIRQQPVEGVDLDLVVAANAVAQSQEKMLGAAEAASYNPAYLRSDVDLRKTYTDAGQQTAAAITRLKALAAKLSARYGVAFPPYDE